MLRHKTTLKTSRQSGFTLVELIVVIVIIAILAVIAIVAYNGVQNRAKTSTGETAARAIASKLESFRSQYGVYPTYCQVATSSLVPTGLAPAVGTTGSGTCTAGGTTVGSEAQVKSTSGLTPGTATATDYTAAISKNNTVVSYYVCPTGNAGFMYYYNYTNSTVATLSVGKTSC